MFVRLSSFFVLLLAATAVFAAPPLDSRVFQNGLWVGGGVNWSDIDFDVAGSDDSFGYNIGAGWQFLNYFGVNAKWKDLGDFKDSGAKAEIDGFTVGLNAGYPITGRIAIHGGIGYFDFDSKVTSSGVPGSVTDSDDGLYLSAGVSSQVGNIIVQPQVVWYDTSNADLYSLELNAYYKFAFGQ